MLQIILTILIYLILVIPVGIYVYHIAAGKHTFADPVFDRVDGVIYKLGGVNPKNGMRLEKIRFVTDCDKRSYDSFRVHYPENPEYRSFQSEWDWGNGGITFLQYDYQFYDKYKPAALFR